MNDKPLSRIRGRAWVFGDNIDTDIIAPGELISFGLGDAAEEDVIRKNAFRAVRPGLYKEVKVGDVLIAGRNFGLGSHREPANKALYTLGFRAVVAESMARLFFRNAVAIGIAAIVVAAASKSEARRARTSNEIERLFIQDGKIETCDEFIRGGRAVIWMPEIRPWDVRSAGQHPQ